MSKQFSGNNYCDYDSNNDYNNDYNNNYNNNNNNNYSNNKLKIQEQRQMKQQLSKQDLCKIELYKGTIIDLFKVGKVICNESFKNNNDKLYCNDLLVNQVNLIGALTYKRYKENKQNGCEYKNDYISSLCKNEVENQLNKLNNKNKKLMEPIANTLIYALNGNELNIKKQRRTKKIKKNITSDSMNTEASMYIGSSCDQSYKQKQRMQNIDNIRYQQQNEYNSYNKNNKKMNPKYQPNLNSLYNISQTNEQMIFDDVTNNPKTNKKNKKKYDDSKDSDMDEDMPDDNINYNDNNWSNTPDNGYLMKGYKQYRGHIPCRIIQGSKNDKYIKVKLALPNNQNIIHKIEEKFIETDPDKVKKVEQKYLKKRGLPSLGYTSMAELDNQLNHMHF